MEISSLARLIPSPDTFQMLVSYTILVSLTFILLTELSQILIEMHEGSKYVLQIIHYEILLGVIDQINFTRNCCADCDGWHKNLSANALHSSGFQDNQFIPKPGVPPSDC